MTEIKSPNNEVRRRIDFLIQEVRYEARRDQVITIAMRVISNYATVGKDCSSFAVKRLNRFVSKEAARHLAKCRNLVDWSRATINEHQMPLKQTWEWLNQQIEFLDVDKVWQHFKLYPMVTVLREEDAAITLAGHRYSGAENRYQAAGIEIVVLEESPEDMIGKDTQTRSRLLKWQ